MHSQDYVIYTVKWRQGHLSSRIYILHSHSTLLRYKKKINLLHPNSTDKCRAGAALESQKIKDNNIVILLM